tara:strand:+ start:116 stop:634 length:519 start_codon:yes stop_codon:yes gene_type:complete
MKISISKIIIFSFIIFSFLIFWQGLKKNNDYDTKNLIGNKISNFQLIDLNNEKKLITEEDLRKNEYTLINFFASWCSPCRTEHEYLLKLSNKKIRIIGINFKDKKSNAISFLEELGNPYDFIGKDKNGKISVLFGIYGIPETLIVDSSLIVIKKYIGPIDQNQYDEILKLIQ